MYFARLLRVIRARLLALESVKGLRGWRLALLSRGDSESGGRLAARRNLLPWLWCARRSSCRSLWDGEPALPTSPSPGAFKFLRTLAMVMGDAGGDLWSPAAVAVLKRQVSKQLSAAWLEALRALEESEEGDANGNSKVEATGEMKGEVETEAGKAAEDADHKTEATEPAKEETDQKAKTSFEKQDLLVQWLMDISYLGLFLGSDDALRGLEETIAKESGLETAAKERLAKASQDYFKKTSLLFGLLV